jgi:hypothetical protein
VKDIVHTFGEENFITQEGDFYDEYLGIWESIDKACGTSVKMYAKGHEPVSPWRNPFALRGFGWW